MLRVYLPVSNRHQSILQTESSRGVENEDERKIKAQLAPRLSTLGRLQGDAKGLDVNVFVDYVYCEFV